LEKGPGQLDRAGKQHSGKAENQANHQIAPPEHRDLQRLQTSGKKRRRKL